jgi:aminopeptidase N
VRGGEVIIDDWFQILMDEGFALHRKANIEGIICEGCKERL